MKQTILNLLQGNKTLMIINSMIIQNQVMMQKKKKKIKLWWTKKTKKKPYNAEIFQSNLLITTILTF